MGEAVWGEEKESVRGGRETLVWTPTQHVAGGHLKTALSTIVLEYTFMF
jgi:hypothetical protein